MISCRNYQPDHNGECTNCDEPYSEHRHAAEVRATLEFMAAEYRRLGYVQDDNQITPEQEARFWDFLAQYLKNEGL